MGHRSRRGSGRSTDGRRLTLVQRPALTFASGSAADFGSAFETAYGRPASPAAALGYDAGRLIDAAVAGAADGVEDMASVVAAAGRSTAVLVSSDLVTASTDATVPAPITRPARKPFPPLMGVGLGVLAALMLLRRRWIASRLDRSAGVAGRL